MILWLSWSIFNQSWSQDLVITYLVPFWIHGAAVTEELPSGSTTTGPMLKDLSSTFIFPGSSHGKMSAASLAILLAYCGYLDGDIPCNQWAPGQEGTIWTCRRSLDINPSWQPLPAYRRQANGGQHMSRFVPSATWHLDK